MRNIWENFCLVGYGKHSKSNLFPAMRKYKKVYVVSSKCNITTNNQFYNLKDALNCLNNKTLFVLSNPPQVHFEMACEVISRGFDIMIEKPAFLTCQDANKISSIINYDKIVFFELLMFKFTKMFSKFKILWENNKENVKAINIKFKIPEFPNNTFRDKLGKKSCLYDIGCYPISLLRHILPFKNTYNINSFEYKNFQDQKLNISSIISNININIEIAVGKEYVNYVELIMEQNYSIKFDKFFYGKPGNKKIIFNSNFNLNIENFFDNNAFEEIFKIDKNFWLKSNYLRFKQMIEVTKSLEDLSKKLDSYE